MSLRELFFYGSFILVFPLIGLILSLGLMLLWNIGLWLYVIPFLPKINLFVSFLIITLLTILRLKVSDWLKR
jgi:hypothetical protein